MERWTATWLETVFKCFSFPSITHHFHNITRVCFVYSCRLDWPATSRLGAATWLQDAASKRSTIIYLTFESIERHIKDASYTRLGNT